MYKKMALLILLGYCALTAANPMESDRVFNINGRWVEISEEMQKDLRTRWYKDGQPIKVNSAIPSNKDTLWVMDTIALQSVLQNQECEAFEITAVNTTDINELSDKDQSLPVGRLDETWVITLCGKSTRYRVVELADERGISTYEIKP